MNVKKLIQEGTKIKMSVKMSILFYKNHLKNRPKDKKIDTVCGSVKKCLKCEQIITGKYVNNRKCGYKGCTNCGKYVYKDHKCYMKKIKVKGGYCIVDKNNQCNQSINQSIIYFNTLRQRAIKLVQNTNVYK